MENRNSEPQPGTSSSASTNHYGVYVAGDLNATTVAPVVGGIRPSSVINQITIKPPFRFNVPTPNPNYKGRKDTLTAIQQHFSNLPKKTNACWDRMVAIVGLGGMGKTETAYKFAAKYRRRFPNVAWINAETEQVALQSFLDLAKHFGIILQNQQRADVNLVQEIYRQIDQNKCGNALFIFDNAMQLNSGATEFGIMDYLPTNDLPNGRFPYILITTQAHDWGQRIKTFEVGGLSEQESLEFFKNSFKVKSSVCNVEFKKLYDLIQGYPLIMNLAASQIKYNPNSNPISHLQHQICQYIEQVLREQNKLTCEQISPVWGNKYNKTLSSVWKLSLERLLADDSGTEALEVLQIMSFLKLPIDTITLQNILIVKSKFCLVSSKKIPFGLKKWIGVLDELHLAKILNVHQGNQNEYSFGAIMQRLSQLWARQETIYQDDEEGFRCEVGVHRLIQLVVRQEMDWTKASERILCYLAEFEIFEWESGVNTAVFFRDISKKPQLSSREWSYLGILTCLGNAEACKMFLAREPKTDAAATLWRSYSFNGDALDVNSCIRLVLMEFNGLIKASKKQEDSQLFAQILIEVVCLLEQVVESDIEELLADYTLNIFSLEELPSGFLDGLHEFFPRNLVAIGATVTKRVVQEDAQTMCSVVAERLAATWFAIIRKLFDHHYWGYFWRIVYKIFNSPEASPFKIAELRTCLWNQSLAEDLIQAFEWLPLQISCNGIVECMDICLDGVDILDTRAQKVVSAFTNMTTRWSLRRRDYSRYGIDVVVYEVCCVWIKLLLIDGGRNLESLLECLSRCRVLIWVEERTWTMNIIRDLKQIQRTCKESVHEKYEREYFPQFIQQYSTSEDRQIKALVTLCKGISEPFFTNENE